MLTKVNKSHAANRGFSIAEVVIAMAVIAVVTFTTLTIILSANIATRRSVRHQQAQMYAEDVINCYRISDSEEEFESYLLKSVGFKDEQTLDTIAVNTDLTLDCDYILNYFVDETTRTITVYVHDGDGRVAADHLSYTKYL